MFSSYFKEFLKTRGNFSQKKIVFFFSKFQSLMVVHYVNENKHITFYGAYFMKYTDLFLYEYFIG